MLRAISEIAAATTVTSLPVKPILHSEFASRLPGCDYVGTGADRKARDFFQGAFRTAFPCYSSVVGSCAFAY